MIMISRLQHGSAHNEPRFLFQTWFGSGVTGLYAVGFCWRELVAFATKRGRPSVCAEAGAGVALTT